MAIKFLTKPQSPGGEYYATRSSYSVSLTTTWAGASAPYTQTVSVAGILATDQPHISVVFSSNNTTAQAEEEAFAKIGKVESAAGSLTFTCFTDKPTIALTLTAEVIR